MKAFFGYIAGLLFGVGLGLGGMTDPARVLGFLDIFGAWDPTLLFVLGGAVITTFIGYRVVLRQAKEARRGSRIVGSRLGTFRLLPGAGIRIDR